MRLNLLNSLLAIAAAITFCAASVQGKTSQESPPRPRRAPEQQLSSDARYVVQLGASFRTAEKANELTSQLRRKYPSAHTENPSGSESLYRVRVGPYNSRDDAQQAAIDLESQGFKGVIILPWSQSSRRPAAESSDKTEPAPQIQEADEAMRRAITNLSAQIGLLTDEMRKLRRESQRNSAMMELLLNEDRLAKLEDKIQEAVNNKAQLDAREQEIGRRMRNIQAELSLRGVLRRDEAEAAVRSELQRALDDVRSQQAASQQRIAELNEQAVRLRARVETLRLKLDPVDVKTEKEEN